MALTAGNVRLPADGVGTKLRTYFDGLGDPSTDVHRHVYTPADKEGRVLGDANFPPGGQLVRVDHTLTRPADTTAYTAGDAVANSTSSPTANDFANVARLNDQSGYIKGFKLASSLDTVLAVVRVWLYQASVGSNNDNAAFSTTYADKEERIGFFDLPAMVDVGDCSEAFTFDLNFPFTCSGGSRSIFARYQTLTAFTPGNAQTFFGSLYADLN